MKTKILFVCLGNICRSPAAEGVFSHLILQKGLSNLFKVDSAGTGSWHVGEAADSRMQNAARNRGISLSSLSRQIVLEDFKNFDLILTMDSNNLLAVKTLQRQLNSEGRAIVKPMLSYASNITTLDVPDPYYGGDKGFETVLDLLENACNGLLNDITT